MRVTVEDITFCPKWFLSDAALELQIVGKRQFVCMNHIEFLGHTYICDFSPGSSFIFAPNQVLGEVLMSQMKRLHYKSGGSPLSS